MLGGKKCDVCGGKLHKLTASQVADGNICVMCGRICRNSLLSSVNDIKRAWEENQRRFQNFNPTMTISNMGSGYIFVDTPNQLCYISQGKKVKDDPVVFKFSEIDEYRIEQIGQKTITKSKGGIGRAVVGGAVFGVAGAIVGASTAKTETKQVGGVPFLYVELNLNGVKTTVSISNPPAKASDFLENAIEVE